MTWKNIHTNHTNWFPSISNLEHKTKVAKKVADKLKDGDVIGVGSGSTSYLALCELSKRSKKESISFVAIPTSKEIELVCHQLSVPITTLSSHMPDWGFDGADEVDGNLSLIKGRGGALFREKLVMSASPLTYILADSSKQVQVLGANFPVPIEVFPESLFFVESELSRLFKGRLLDLSIRKASGKDGPIITEHGNFLLDAKFSYLSDDDEHSIKKIPGVIESGLFMGYAVELISD